jgi:hypothetical protein
MCSGKVGNMWKTSSGFLRPLFEPFGFCSIPKYLVMGRRFQVSIFGVGPYIYKEGNGIEGIDLELFKIVASHFKFIPSFSIERGWGRLINGTWDGTIGKVTLYQNKTENPSSPYP